MSSPPPSSGSLARALRASLSSSGEARLIPAAFLALFGVLCAQTLLETARDTLFLTHLPVAQLPWIHLTLAFLTLAAGGLSASTARWRRRWGRGATRRTPAPITSSSSLWLGAVVTAALGLALVRGGRAAVYLLFLWSGMFSGLSVTKIWTLLAETIDVSRAKRLYGKLAAGAGAGAVAGAALARLCGPRLSPHGLVLLAAGIVSLTALGPGRALARPVMSDPDGGGDSSGRPGAGAVVRTVADPYVARLLVTTLLATAVATLLDYSFKAAVAAHLPAERLPTFLASFHLTTSVASLLAQLFGLAVVVRIVGVRRAQLVLPLLLLAGVVMAAASGGLGALVLVRGLDGAFRNSFHRPSSELLQVALPDRLRRRAKPIIDVIALRGGQAAGALVLVVMTAASAGSGVRLAVVAALLAGWLLFAHGLGRRYVDLLRSSLIGPARLVVGHAAGPAFDGETLASVLAAIEGGTETEVMAGLDLLAAHGRAALIPVRLLAHPRAAVVRRALELLPASLPAPSASEMVKALDRLLAHADGAVRTAALRRRVALEPDRALLTGLAEGASCAAVRCVAQVALVARGWIDPAPALRGLSSGVADGPLEVRLVLAQALADHPDPRFEPLLRALLAGREPAVLELAASTLGAIGGRGALEALVSLLERREGRTAARAALARAPGAFEAVYAVLTDPSRSAGLRAHAPRALVEIDGARAVGPLLDGLLLERDGFVRYRILRALHRVRRACPRTPLDEDILGRAALAAVRSAHRYLAWRLFLEDGARRVAERGTATRALLCDLLAEKEENAVERLFLVLALRYPREDFRRLLRELRSGACRARAAGRELVENLLKGPARALTLALVDEADDRTRLLALAGGQPLRAPTDRRVLAAIRQEEAGGMLAALAARHADELSLDRARAPAADPRQVAHA
jgi:AAA family ATP:ADP antiporter